MGTWPCRLGCFKLTVKERNAEVLFVGINGIWRL